MKLFCPQCARLTDHQMNVRHPDLQDCAACATTREHLSPEEQLVKAGVATSWDSARRIYLNTKDWWKLLKPDGDPVDRGE